MTAGSHGSKKTVKKGAKKKKTTKKPTSVPKISNKNGTRSTATCNSLYAGAIMKAKVGKLPKRTTTKGKVVYVKVSKKHSQLLQKMKRNKEFPARKKFMMTLLGAKAPAVVCRNKKCEKV